MDEIVTSYCIAENELGNSNGRIVAFPDFDSFAEVWVESLQSWEPTVNDLLDWDYDLWDDLTDQQPYTIRETFI